MRLPFGESELIKPNTDLFITLILRHVFSWRAGNVRVRTKKMTRPQFKMARSLDGRDSRLKKTPRVRLLPLFLQTSRQVCVCVCVYVCVCVAFRWWQQSNQSTKHNHHAYARLACNFFVGGFSQLHTGTILEDSRGDDGVVTSQ
jgi:hypothetical protein